MHPLKSNFDHKLTEKLAVKVTKNHKERQSLASSHRANTLTTQCIYNTSQAICTTLPCDCDPHRCFATEKLTSTDTNLQFDAKLQETKARNQEQSLNSLSDCSAHFPVVPEVSIFNMSQYQTSSSQENI